MLRGKQRVIFTLVVSLMLLWAWFPVVWAQEKDMDEAPEIVRTTESVEISPFDNLAVVLVIDISGSMSYTDLLRLRETAAGMFIDLLGAEDYLGVVTFDDRPEVVVPLSPVGNPADKEALMKKLSSELDPRGDTNYIEALKLAHRQFAETDTGQRVPVILLLTDGEPDPYPGSRNDTEFMVDYMETLWGQVEKLAQEGILAYTVGFSDEIDPDAIRRIATDTRGKYYILSEPADLLVTFYQALENLKDRRGFLEEKVDLGSGASHTFNFTVGEYTRQVNLVLVSETEAKEANMTVSVKPPDGAATNINELLIGGRDNYLLVILSQPQEKHYGPWEVEITGTGEIQALGNADLYLEALLVEPDPNAHYPLHEPMDIRVEVITRERYADAIFHLDLQVAGPGDPSPEIVPLSREGNSFRGTYESVDKQGDYELSWQLFRGEEIVFSSSALVSVQLLPALSTDFWVDEEGFCLGKEMVVSASLTSGEERLQQGPHFQVDTFKLNLEYRDGARFEMELFDSGNSEHGNSRAGDGIWSNRLLFDREGMVKATLSAAGTYRGSDFILKKNFSFNVSAPGQIFVYLLSEDLWTLPGERLTIPLEFASESPFTQTLRISSSVEDVDLLQDRVVIARGETGTVMLEVEIADTLQTGSHYISLVFETEDGMTLVQPETIELEVQVLTGGEVFLKKFSGLAVGIGIAIGSVLLLTGIVFGGGSLLYRYDLLPRLNVNGVLLYQVEANNHAHEEKKVQKIDLSQKAKPLVVVSFGSGNQQTDFTIVSNTFGYAMVIYNQWNDHLPRFWRGWKALLIRTLTVETILTCSPPGILIVEGKVLTRKVIQHNDEFETGGFTFQYQRESEKGACEKSRGVNILDGKI